MAQAAIPLVTTIGGSLLGALGGSGKQGQQQTAESGTSKTSKTQEGSTAQQSEQNQTGISQGTESPLMTMFRQFLVPKFGEEFNKVQEPIYGDAQKNQYLSSLNDLAKGSTDQLTQGLAARGALNSGRLGQGLSDIEMNRTNQAASFFGQLPFLNEQARRESTSNLLGLGLNFAGRGPTGQINVGQSTGQQTGQFQGTENSQTDYNKNATTTGQGPGFGSGLASTLGGALGRGAFDSPLTRLFRAGTNNIPNTFPSSDAYRQLP